MTQISGVTRTGGPDVADGLMKRRTRTIQLFNNCIALRLDFRKFRNTDTAPIIMPGFHVDECSSPTAQQSLSPQDADPSSLVQPSNRTLDRK